MTTQKAFASYQEIIDLHTESDSVSIIGIHTPVSDTPRKMFGGFFDQFKKFKYLGCSVKLVPAARLPADPLQVSAQYENEEAPFQTIDPRDMLNPIMFHGCHGNDMGVILNRLYNLNSADRSSDSIDLMEQDFRYDLSDITSGALYGFQLEDLYYKALTDNSWKKAHPQRGFRKSGLRPLVYKMATNLQFLGENNLGTGGIPGLPEITSQGNVRNPVSTYGRQFFTPGLTGLGWLDTRNVMTSPVTGTYDASEDLDDALASYQDTVNALTLEQQEKSEASLPLIYMGIIMLPPAYKQEMYFRMVVNHHFAFAGFRGISFSNNIVEAPSYFDFNQDEEDDGDTGGDVTPDDPDDPGTGGDTPDDPDEPVYLLSKKGSQYVGENNGNFPYWFADVYLAGEYADDPFIGTMVVSSQFVNTRAVGIELYSAANDVSVYCPCAMWVVSPSTNNFVQHRAILYGGVWKHFTRTTASSSWSASSDMTTSDVQSAVGVWPLTDDWNDIVSFCGENGRDPDTVTADDTTTWTVLS